MLSGLMWQKLILLSLAGADPHGKAAPQAGGLA
jgi:hypothetical protein